ncbi:MAG TPA: integrase arm-type DNA-binding domain-containing protein [Stellaceae bacterium]|nr:integrase arm-type DNA-binding domain-containing protein [Stellaceae bacterium]
MARKIHQLNATRLPSTRGYHVDGGGLFLRVGPTGARSWVFRYRVEKRLHEMGLGSLHTINLAEARDAAHDERRILLAFRQGKGEHPLAIRKAAKAARRIEAAKAVTFRECAERYIESKSVEWRNPRNVKQWNASLTRYAYPVIGTLPVQAIDTTLVLKVLEPIWTKTPETASRVRQRIEVVLDAAIARGERTGDNPAKRIHIEQAGLAKKSKVAPVEHHPALPYPKIGAFMATLREQDGLAARALEFAILTAMRSNEVLGARWSEIDLAERVWIVPAARMKGGKEHRVPLSDATMAILHGSITKGSTTATWAAERTAFPHEIREMALAHTVGSAVERAYQRGDLFEKRRQLAEAWAAFCARAEPAAGSGAVVPLRA